MERLHAVKKDMPHLSQLWCGPAVIASITGDPLSKVYAALRKAIPGYTSDLQIKGTTCWQVEQAFKTLGWKMIKCDYFATKPLPPGKYGVQNQFGHYQYNDPTAKPTLAFYARKNRAKFARHAMLVNVTGHWTSLFGRRGFDNHCPGAAPVSLGKLSFRRSRVQQTWRIIRMDEVLQPDPVLAAPFIPKVNALIAKKRKVAKVKRANTIANKLALSIDFAEIVSKLDKDIADAEGK